MSKKSTCHHSRYIILHHYSSTVSMICSIVITLVIISVRCCWLMLVVAPCCFAWVISCFSHVLSMIFGPHLMFLFGNATILNPTYNILIIYHIFVCSNSHVILSEAQESHL